MPKTMLGMPAATYRQLKAADCTRCGRHAASNQPYPENHPQRDRTTLCDSCIDGVNREIDRARAVAKAAAPKCEGCGKGQRTYTLMPGTANATHLCRGCRDRVNKRIRVPVLFGAPTASRAQILAAAQR
jgi:hypothetical protein